MPIKEQKIKCPNCGEWIDIDDVLTHQVEGRIRSEFEAKQKDRERELTLKLLKEAKVEAEKEQNAKTKFLEEQLKKQLTDATKAKDELARKLEQGSQQTQGEVLELELEEILRAQFPQDEILPVPKGVKGADIIQKVLDRSGRVCGQIVWESKKTKNWVEGWIQKLKEDQRAIKADLAVIVSVVLPEDVKGFALRSSVWVCDVKMVCALATA